MRAGYVRRVATELTVDLRFEKYDGSVTRTFERHVVVDTPDGLVLAGGPGDRDHWDDGPVPAGWSVTWLPAGGFWIATWFVGADGRTGFYGDVGFVVERTCAMIRFVDVDLDVVGDSDGYRIVDEDEFDAHRIGMRYPAGLVDRARRAAPQLLDAIRRGELDAFGRDLLVEWQRTRGSAAASRRAP